MSFLDRFWHGGQRAPGDTPDIGYLVGKGCDAAVLDRLLADIEKELKGSRDLIVRRLRRDRKLGGQVVCWSYPEVEGKDLDYKAAEKLLISRLAPVGVGLDGSPMFSSDDDGCTMVIWRYGHVRYSDAPPQLRSEIERLEKFDSKTQKTEASSLARSGKFPLLVAWLCEAVYKGIPAGVLRESKNATATALLTRLLRSPYSDIRARAADALGPLGGEGAARALCALLPQSENETLEVAYALFRLPFAESIPALSEALQKATDFYDQVYLAKALARSGGETGLTFLIEGLRHRNRESECVEAILALDDARAVPALASHFQSFKTNGGDPSRQKRIEEFLARHGAPKVQAPPDGVPGQVRTSIGIIANETPWSVQASVLKLREAIQNTWNVRCQIIQLTEEQAASLRRQWPMQAKQWVADGQYQIELSPNSIFVHAYGSWVDVGPVLFLYQNRIWYVNVAPGVDLTKYIYDRPDDLSHMAKITIPLLTYIGAKDREKLLVCLEGDLFQGEAGA